MTFGEKLLKLRKENGLSQETLAEKLNTTRQAISKWENNQGYPETEKLLLLSNIFEIPVDNLLKENMGQAIPNEKGYYVSKECADGFLSFHRKTTRRTAIGVAIMVFSGVPYFLFESDIVLSITLASVVLVAGLIFILSMAFMGNPYRKLKSERLLFDPIYFSELVTIHEMQKRKYISLIILAIIFLCTGGILGIAKFNTFPVSEVQCVLTAFSVYCFIYVLGIADTYHILINSEQRMDTLYWRMVKKIKK